MLKHNFKHYLQGLVNQIVSHNVIERPSIVLKITTKNGLYFRYDFFSLLDVGIIYNNFEIKTTYVLQNRVNDLRYF